MSLRSFSPAAIEEIILRSQIWSFADPGRIRAWADEFIAAHRATEGGLSLEIGTWKGGTALVLCEILELLYHARQRPMLFTVDPYGDKPYDGGDSPAKEPLFGDKEYVLAKTLLAPYAHHAHFHLPSTEFFRTVARKHYWWRGMARPIDHFTFALIDGEHSFDAIKAELDALLPLMRPEGCLVIDNVDNDPRTLRFFFPEDDETRRPHFAVGGVYWPVTLHESTALAGQKWLVLSPRNR